MPALADAVRGDTSMQAFEFLSPFPDLDKGSCGSRRGHPLRALHVGLLSSPGDVFSQSATGGKEVCSSDKPWCSLCGLHTHLQCCILASYVDLESLEEQTMERQDADTPTAHEPKRRTIVCLYAQADEPFYLQLK